MEQFLIKQAAVRRPGQLNGQGRTAAQVATANGKDGVAALLQGLSL
jgi:hypothetical protein